MRERVPSSGYTSEQYVPPTGERREHMSEPKWDINRKSTLKPVSQLEPVPRRFSNGPIMAGGAALTGAGPASGDWPAAELGGEESAHEDGPLSQEYDEENVF